MARLSTYEVRFRALAPDDLGENPSGRLTEALETMPGIARALGAEAGTPARSVGGAFRLEVAGGMAAAARDSSRLAKEALKLAGMGDARLVDLQISLQQVR
jgi:hypothetical protein